MYFRVFWALLLKKHLIDFIGTTKAQVRTCQLTWRVLSIETTLDTRCHPVDTPLFWFLSR